MRAAHPEHKDGDVLCDDVLLQHPDGLLFPVLEPHPPRVPGLRFCQGLLQVRMHSRLQFL